MDKNRFLFSVIILTLSFWVIEAMMHTFIFAEGELFKNLLPSEKNDLWMRLITLFFILGFSLYASISRVKEERLFKKLKKMSLAVDHSPASVVITDSKGLIEYVNEEFCRITGYSSKEAMGKTPAILQSGYTPAETYETLWSTITSGNDWRGDMLNKKRDGDLYWEDVRISPVKNGKGRITHYIAIKEDITERRVLEEKIKHSEKELKAILDNMQDAFYRTNNDGIIIMCSPSASSLFGYTRDELIGMPITTLYVNPALRETLLENLKEAGGGLNDVETELLKKDKKIITVSTNAHFYHDNEGDIAGVEGTVRDITERKKAELELENTNRLKELYIDIMSHDILNPVNVIVNAAEILKNLEQNSQKIEFIDMISEASLEIEELVDLSKKYSKIRSIDEIEKKQIELNNLLGNILSKLALNIEDRKIKVIHSSSHVREVVPANEMIREVFYNFISNAIKYGPPGGTIELGTEALKESVVIYVKDRGQGIPDEDKEKIFDRFQRLDTTAMKGSGLGLAIVRRIVELHDGKVWVEDNPGGGSIFKVSLPR